MDNRRGTRIARRLLPALLLWLIASARAAGQSEEDPLNRAFEERVARVAEKAAAVTVAIHVDRLKDEAEPPVGTRRRRGVPGNPFASRPSDSAVSGTVIDPEGYILTSYFNVLGELEGIEVTMPDGTDRAAELVGYHREMDIALLKVDAKDLTTLPPTNRTTVRTGMFVLAVGRTPDGQGITVNPGVLSAPGRLRGRGVQVDARLNFGNVGGPLIDLEGRLVGVTCKVDTKWALQHGQNSGVGFAVSLEALSELLPKLKTGQKYRGTGAAYLGIMADQEATDIEGVRLARVIEDQAADLAGLKMGDVIIALDGQRIRTFKELVAALTRKAVGDVVRVRFLRNGDEHEVDVTLGERPS